MATDGCDATYAAGHLHHLINKYAYIGLNCEHIMLPGSGQVLMADLATIVDIVSLIPEYRPEEVREEAAKLFVRYIGGDLDRERYPLRHLRAMDPDTVLSEMSPSSSGRNFSFQTLCTVPQAAISESI
jgi:hypothetical protein